MKNVSDTADSVGNDLRSKVDASQSCSLYGNDMSTQTNPLYQQPLVNVSGLVAALETFATERNWAQFHSPKNLVMALTGEVGELVEIFQWMTEKASIEAATDPQSAQGVRDELADVLMYVVRLSSVLGVNLDEAVREKLLTNQLNYPIDKAHGNSKKYTDL